ncbi:acyltransferase family protein [Sphingomonas sp. OTU376]|uniref:acyltransferase family protein n=1 Tax=Sphingomonas sp. OTU376 TaxID=3043863 RepID=UPI00313EB688
MNDAPSAPARLGGLDLFRGLTVACMVIVNTPGSWDHVWWPLDHAEWHGFTPTDLVFPAFLCAMGVALGLSFPRKVDGKLWGRVARRTLLLILIGWAWQMLARPGLADFRVFGVLPRLGLCYGLAATLAILTARKHADGRAHLGAAAIGIASLVLLIGYWALLAFVPAPGYAAGDLSPAGNLAGYIDRITVTTHHMYRFGTDAAGNIVYDPEGLLSTLPALVNVLLGMLAALLWKAAPERATLRILIAGIALAALGYALSFAFPLNKKLWTSSFALLTSGLSGIIFVACIVAARSAAVRTMLWPLDVLGMNAILGYLLSLLLSLAAMRSGFQAWAWEGLAALLPGNLLLASFLFALGMLLVVLALLIPLHRRGIHLRL